MKIETAIVLAIDYSRRANKSHEDYDIHVAVRSNETGEIMRLRTGVGTPIHLSHFGIVREGLLENVLALFEVGTPVTFSWMDVPETFRDREGYDPSDVIVPTPSAIERFTFDPVTERRRHPDVREVPYLRLVKG